MIPGRRLRRWAIRVCAVSTLQRLIDPVIADLQHEYARAEATRQRLRAGIALLRGYCAFWRIVAVHVPALWAYHTISEFCTSHRESFMRAFVPAAITMFIVSASLVVEPARRINQSDQPVAWLLILLLLPQSIPFAIPLGLFTGIVEGLRSRPVTIRQVSRTIVIFGLTGTLVSAGAIVWVVPATNQVFRTVIAGRVIPKGDGELTPRELRKDALALRMQGQRVKAGYLLLEYHARWAVAGAALVFAVFGLGVSTLRLGRVATALVAATAIVMYVTYFDQLGETRVQMFSHEGVALSFAWLPNLLILLTGLAFLTKADDPRLPAT